MESIDDRVLALLDKGHTRADFFRRSSACREAGLTLVPTFVAFHPWLTLDDYCDLLDTIAALDLVDHVAPIQLAIRLLVPAGSRLLERDEMRRISARSIPPRWRTRGRIRTPGSMRCIATSRHWSGRAWHPIAAVCSRRSERWPTSARDVREPAPLGRNAAEAVPFLDEPGIAVRSRIRTTSG